MKPAIFEWSRLAPGVQTALREAGVEPQVAGDKDPGTAPVRELRWFNTPTIWVYGRYTLVCS